MVLHAMRNVLSYFALAVLTLFLCVFAQLPAVAFTADDAHSAIDAYLKAFVSVDGATATISRNQNGGDPGFWVEAEEIEVIEDANDHNGGLYKSQVAELLAGFRKARGDNWKYNQANDDVAWAVIAFTRGYETTGELDLLTIAQSNFDMMFSRAWDPVRGALYWSGDKNTYNSCIECPAGIAAFLLSKTLHDQSYLIKAQNLFAWEKANLFNSATGAVYDRVPITGGAVTWASTYNQGTFVGLANFLGDTANAKVAADYTRDHMGQPSASGFRILPEYGSGGGDICGFNSIGLRWIARFVRDHNLQKEYLGWLQANANTAWSVRRQSDDLCWCQWMHQTPDGDLYSWDCVNMVAALAVTPPDEK